MPASAPDLDRWLPKAAVTIHHRRESAAPAPELWRAARELRLSETHLLGRLIRWRIPGVAPETSFEELFGNPPFVVLHRGDQSLVSGLVGRIWTLRRDYPLIDPEDFPTWSRSGTAKVVFGHWVQSSDGAPATLRSESRVQTFGAQGRLGLATVRPLIRGFEHLVGSDALSAAVRRAERQSRD